MKKRLKKNEPKLQVNIRLEKKQIDTLREISKQTGVGVSTSVRFMIEDYLKMYRHFAAKHIAATNLIETIESEPEFVVEHGVRKLNPCYHGKL